MTKKTGLEQARKIDSDAEQTEKRRSNASQPRKNMASVWSLIEMYLQTHGSISYSEAALIIPESRGIINEAVHFGLLAYCPEKKRFIEGEYGWEHVWGRVITRADKRSISLEAAAAVLPDGYFSAPQFGARLGIQNHAALRLLHRFQGCGLVTFTAHADQRIPAWKKL